MADKLIQDLTAGAFALTDLLEHQPIAGPPSLKGDVAALVTLLDTIYAPITGGAYVLKAGDTMTGLLTIAQATANTSNLILSGQSLTAANAQSLLSMTGTWNTSGNPVALRLAITNTASGTTARFLEFLAGAGGATSVFTVNKAGAVQMAGGSSSAPGLLIGNIGAGSDPGFFRLADNQLGLALSGIVAFNWNASFFRSVSGMQYGWVADASDAGNATDTGLNRNAAGIVEVNNGTSGTFRDLYARIVRTSPGFTVATLPAAGTVGRRTYVTDAAAPAFMVAVVGGGAVVTPVFDNGAAWVSA